MFTGLPDRLTRPVVRGACLRAADAPADAARAFLTVMAWGYGQVGYGPFRVRRCSTVRRLPILSFRPLPACFQKAAR
jgi:hypothetical protein